METPEVQEFAVEIGGERLDRFLQARLPALSRNRLQQLIESGFLHLNGHPSRKPSRKLSAGDRLRLEVPSPEALPHLVPQEIPLDILHEDSDVLVLNKPVGLVVHPGPGHPSWTLVNALLAYSPRLSSINGAWRPGLVHRLDKDTSGTLVVAKNDVAHESLKQQFQQHQIRKRYWALVYGSPSWAERRVETRLDRHPQDRKRWASGGRGREAVSTFRVHRRFGPLTWMDVEPLTGRTHQIRVHSTELGHLIVGDSIYGKERQKRKELPPEHREALTPLKGHALHCRTLGFFHPRSKQWMELSSDLPAGFSDALKALDRVMEAAA